MAAFTLHHEVKQSAIHAALVLILPLSAIFLVLQPVVLHASALVDSTHKLEIRRSSQATDSYDPMNLDMQFKVLAGYTVFFEEDMGDTYGGIPMMSLEASLAAGEITSFVFGLGYGSTSGNPHYNSPEFEGYDELRLKALPFTVGLQVNSSRNPRFRLNWGASFEAVWMEERIPDTDEPSSASYRHDRGWGQGFKFILAPEWCSRDRLSAFGLTFTWGGSSGEVGKGYKDHEVCLMGMSASLHYTRAL
jgi:hypothetical protein